MPSRANSDPEMQSAWPLNHQPTPNLGRVHGNRGVARPAMPPTDPSHWKWYVECMWWCMWVYEVWRMSMTMCKLETVLAVTSWKGCWWALRVILVARPFLGRFPTVLTFLHLWLMAFTVVCWNPKPKGTLILSCSWGFFSLSHDMLLLETFFPASLCQTGSI